MIYLTGVAFTMASFTSYAITILPIETINIKKQVNDIFAGECIKIARSVQRIYFEFKPLFRLSKLLNTC
jgi:hypothetical protein